ncbi:MAG: heparan-alpha-glucosaminide N-acetyltransferase domain-containing protein [Promethearchaeota archaeon]
MSNSNHGIQDTESIHLSKPLNEKIPNEKLTGSSSSQRIASIDFVKGFAMAFIILAHSALSWFDDDWRYIYGLVFAFLDILGPSLFVFLSALSVIFSIKKKKGVLSEKAIRKRIFTRALMIIILGVIFNPISLGTTNLEVPFPLNLWGWNFFMFIGFSQIFSYYVLKLPKISRGIIGVIVIYISPFIRQFLFDYKSTNAGIWILHFIITSPLPQVPFLPWIAICFISTIFGESLYDAMIRGPGEAYKNLFRMFLYWGLFLAIMGIFGPVVKDWKLITGLKLQTASTIDETEYYFIDLLRIANQQDYYQFPGMPIFMIRSTTSNMFYNLGVALIILSICFYVIDIKKKSNEIIKMVLFYGKVSMSLFIIHHIFLPLYLGQFSIVFLPLIYVAYCGFLGLLMYVWHKYFNGVGSPEWLMGQRS